MALNIGDNIYQNPTLADELGADLPTKSDFGGHTGEDMIIEIDGVQYLIAPDGTVQAIIG